ncbi:MAG: homoserine O-acetyltransferase [Gemmataceae bacterium]|nr:homoserine O-acetyltransferase [Gemmataceae bacterium]
MTDKLEPTFEGDFTFADAAPFALDSGATLSPVTLRYAWYGAMMPARDNVILICHALSGSARVGDWWPDLLGAGKPFDPARHCILGINVIGSCYGSTGPTSLNPATGLRYGGDFPVVSIRDMVRAQAVLLDHLGIARLHAVVGGSIGGMQALAWAVDFPERVPHAIAIGAAPLNAMGLALSHLQRQAIRGDPAWRGGHYAQGQQPVVGLALARAIATITYKSDRLFRERYGRRPNRAGEDPTRDHAHRFDVAGYLDHQGQVFVDRFDANSYLVLSRAQDTFELGRNPDEEAKILSRAKAKMTLIGIAHDWLFPPEEVRGLAERFQAARVAAEYAEIVTNHGHDGFLAHPELLAPLVIRALE